MEIADKSGADMQKTKTKLAKMNAHLSTASDKLVDAEAKISNIDETTVVGTSYRYFQKCDNDLKEVNQELTAAKSLGNDVLKALRKVAKK